VGAEEGCEIHSGETLVLKESEERGGWRVDIWEEAVWRRGAGICAPDEGLDLRTAGARDDCVVAGKD
jgi:hypothetical protein